MKVHYSSKTDDWATPWEFFDKLNDEFKFTLDPCASARNHKTDRYFSRTRNGLTQDWSAERVFMNPPYGRVIHLWIRKAFESAKAGALVVCLIPSRTDTSYWHDYCMKGEIRFIRGRLRFGGSKNSAPFPSAVVIFDPAKLNK